MKIKINNKSQKIKPASELTVKEYILVFADLTKKTSNLEILIKYISITTGINYRNVADIDINETALRRLFAYIGEIPNVSDISESKEFYHKYSGKTLYQKSVNWRTVGVRKLLEERKEDNQLKLAVYLLAVYVSNDYDSEQIDKIYNELQDYNAIEVFSFVIFFFKKLFAGKSSGRSFLRMLKKKVSTSIPKLFAK